MNLDKAFVLLFASLGAVAGFAPSAPTKFSVASRVASVSNVRIASAIFSEVEEAAEVAEVTAEAEAPVAEETASEESAEEPAAPAEWDTAIYVGNMSFGE